MYKRQVLTIARLLLLERTSPRTVSVSSRSSSLRNPQIKFMSKILKRSQVPCLPTPPTKWNNDAFVTPLRKANRAHCCQSNNDAAKFNTAQVSSIIFWRSNPLSSYRFNSWWDINHHEKSRNKRDSRLFRSIFDINLSDDALEDILWDKLSESTHKTVTLTYIGSVNPRRYSNETNIEIFPNKIQHNLCIDPD